MYADHYFMVEMSYKLKTATPRCRSAQTRGSLGDYPKAIKYFNLGIAGNNSDDLMYFYRAFAYEKDGKLGKAIDDYTKTIELNPELGQAYAKRGTAAIAKIVEENQGTYISIFGREACTDLKKAKELGIDVQNMIDLYCD